MSGRRSSVDSSAALRKAPSDMTDADQDDPLHLFRDLDIGEKERLFDDYDFASPGGNRLSNSPIYRLPDLSEMPKGTSDDFLMDSDKHDYDWLLTPPGTPNSASAVEWDVKPAVSPNNVSPLKTRPLPAVRTSTKPSAHETSAKKSVTGFSSRQTTPTYSGSSRQTTPSYSAGSRQPTPTRGTSTKKLSTPRSAASSRSPTPTSKPISSNSSSRPSTPTSALSRQPSSPKTSIKKPAPHPRSASTGKVSAMTTRIPAMTRGISPTLKARPTTPSLVAGITSETPHNLRTVVPGRPSSVKKGRPGVSITPPHQTAHDVPKTNGPPRRQPSPSLARGRALKDSHSDQKPSLQTSKLHNSVDRVSASTVSKMPDRSGMVRLVPSTLHSKKNVKSGPSESAGFGMTLSKSSFEMALRHMDIHKTTKSVRSSTTSTSSLYSLWSGTTKSKRSNISDSTGPSGSNTSSEYGASVAPDHEGSEFSDDDFSSEKGRKPHRSSKQDNVHFKNESESTNWLLEHTGDDPDDQFLFANNGFEFLSDPIDNYGKDAVIDEHFDSISQTKKL